MSKPFRELLIIDLFAGLQPILLSYISLTEDEIKIPFRPSIILDSNTVSYIHQYVTSNESFSAHHRSVIFELLKFIISNNLDYNPFFYYLEGSAKNENNALLKYAQEISHSILKLHTMNDEKFLATGEISTDSTQLDLYIEKFGVQTLEEMAPLYARSMILPQNPLITAQCHILYATLLKIGLIHKKSRQGIVKKYEQLRKFMNDELNIALGIERMLALGYFIGEFDNFIPIQRGADSKRLFKRLRSAAWDLYLLRLPSNLLITSDINTEIVLGYICTSDRAIKQITQACKIKAVMGIVPEAHIPKPLISYDFSSLEFKLDSITLANIIKRDKEWQLSRSSNSGETAKPISIYNLIKLISELEAEASEFCDK